MTPAELAPALLHAALTLAPPASHAAYPWHRETIEQTEARYAALALDVAAVALSERPVKGLGRVDSAALLLAVAIGESGLAEDVTRADGCYRLDEWERRCDRDRATGYWQIWPDAHGLSRTEAQGEDGARIALRAIRSSVSRCWHMAPEWRLSALGTGDRCIELPEAKKRWTLAKRTIGLVRSRL